MYHGYQHTSLRRRRNLTPDRLDKITSAAQANSLGVGGEGVTPLQYLYVYVPLNNWVVILELLI